MGKVKSFSVGDGDMFYINHNSDNFTIIDCCLYYEDDVADAIIAEIKSEEKGKNITRFISTHPDDDHISGIVDLFDQIEIPNFYCVKNEATKDDESGDFDKYCELRDGDTHFYLYKGCDRKWMNKSSDERGSAGLSCWWPITNNEKYKAALKAAKEGKSPNNISPAIRYSIEDGASFLWMGDMETDMQKEMQSLVTIPATDVVFAPHHGRDSGKMPKALLDELNPKLIVIGEAPSKHLDYYSGYTTITQNSAGDILFNTDDSKYIHIYVSNENYSKDDLVQVRNHPTVDDMYYIGSIEI